ncbi:type II secretion system F family protein [Streptomyces sp. HU2014]|uniref:type II secretion system F family protein n=1 Tax=Streptomyces sp. HU2014 TaxID=2939414 RepID=UPI00200C468B|nr:type II secretion system F family protein [Streptomyces sp. HU2014]UQI48657.1 type II secretion system F family protein [Streptomyces sp. HU2014]
MGIPFGIVLVAAVAAVRGVRGKRAARRRVAALFPSPEPAGAGRSGSQMWSWSGRLPPVRDRLSVMGAGAAGFILVGGAAGCATGLAAAYGMWRWCRRKSAVDEAGGGSGGERRLEEKEAEKQLPLAADLMAACLAAGAGPGQAAEAVGASMAGPVGERLARAAAEVRLGGDPATAWNRIGGLPGPGARELARCLERAQATGVPAVEPIARVAGRLRAERARTAGIRARRAGVLATAPLGLCFLPAFLTVGVVPVVIGLASSLMKGD